MRKPITQQVRLNSVVSYELEDVGTLPSVTLTGKGDYSQQLYATKIENDTAILDIDCLVGTAFDFVHEEELDFESGELSFTISDTVLKDNKLEDLAVAWYDESDNVLQLLDTTYDESSKTITAPVEHFSTYMVVSVPDYFFYNDWENESSTIECGKADIIFVVDTTGSMSSPISNVRSNINSFVTFSTDIYKVCDVFTVLDTVVKAGAVVIAIIIVAEATPVVVANVQGIAYYCKAFGVIEGLNMYSCMGMNGVPDGIISVIQTDLQDGDSDLLKTVTYADDTVIARKGFWSQPAVIRGNEGDELLGNNLCHNFPIIDQCENMVITSNKTMDLSLTSYQTQKGVYNRLAKCIKQLAGFTERFWSDKEVTVKMYNTKMLRVGIPDTSFTIEQKLAFDSARRYAEENGIKMIVTVIMEE